MHPDGPRVTIGPWSYTLGEWATIGAAIGACYAILKWLLAPRLTALIKEAVATDISKITELTNAVTTLTNGLTELTEEMRDYRETIDKELQAHREKWLVYEALRDRRSGDTIP